MTADPLHGGCLCGAVRFVAEGAALYQGLCCCGDCRKASGSGFVGFLGFPAAAVAFSGQTRLVRTRAVHGGESVRNVCPACGSLLFGGIVGQDTEHTLYAGALDDPTRFHPTMAIFNRDRPPWVVLPPTVTEVWETMPG